MKLLDGFYRKQFAKLFLVISALLFVFGCDESKEQRSNRVPIRSQPPVFINSFFVSDDRDQFHHLAEGSEIFPVKWLMALHSSKTQRPFLENLERFGLISDPDNPDGLPIGLTQDKSKDLQFDNMKMVGVTCAACHTSLLTYRGNSVLIEGGPGLFDVENFYQELADSASDTVSNPAKFVLFLDRYGKLAKDPQLVPKSANSNAVHPDEFGNVDSLSSPDQLLIKRPEGLNQLIKQRVLFLQRLTKNQMLGGHGGGFGRTDAFGRLRGVLFGEKEMLALDAPVSYPPLWGFADRTWLHWDGNTNSALERNIGQALGLGATFLAVVPPEGRCRASPWRRPLLRHR